MKVRQFSNLAKFKAELEKAIALRNDIDVKLGDLEAEIVRQLKILNTTYSYPRKTEITDKDYTFENVKVENFDCVVTIQDKFIKKEVGTNFNKLLANKDAIMCKSNDFILCIDNLGRLLRINLNNIPVTATGNRGVYIPSYCEIADNFSIIDYGVMQPRSVNYMYKDGYVSVMNYGQYCGNKKITKVTTSGVPECTNLICGRFDDSYDYIYVMTNRKRFAFMPNEFLRKSSTARTKFVNGLKKDEFIVGCKGLSKEDVVRIMPNFMEHVSKLDTLKDTEIFDKDYFINIKN
jgi:DNA gyrase/topoisomerase IV subunit A